MFVLRFHPTGEVLNVKVGDVLGRANLTVKVQASVSRLHFEIKSLDEASAAIQHISATAEGCVKRNGSDTREIVKSKRYVHAQGW
jgi:hypothetical protein